MAYNERGVSDLGGDGWAWVLGIGAIVMLMTWVSGERYGNGYFEQKEPVPAQAQALDAATKDVADAKAALKTAEDKQSSEQQKLKKVLDGAPVAKTEPAKPAKEKPAGG
jgi:hypothetical protein